MTIPKDFKIPRDLDTLIIDLSEHDKQIRADAIDEYSSKLWQIIGITTVNCKFIFTIDDLRNLEIIIKGLAEQLKGEK